MTNPILDAALAYLNAGLSVIPSNCTKKGPETNLLPRGEDGKPTWTPFQRRIADEKTVRGWFQNGANVAIIGGSVSGGLLIIDFDAKADELLPNWCKQVGKIAKHLPVVKTGKGYHVYLRCHEPGRNLSLAISGAGEKLIETRGEGGYAIAPPSIHAETRKPYQLVQGDLLNIPRLDQEQVEFLLGAARSFDERQRQQTSAVRQQIDRPTNPAEHWLQRALGKVAPGNRNETGFWLACQLRDSGLTYLAALIVMRRYQEGVPASDHAYTVAEASASLDQAFLQPARESASFREEIPLQPEPAKGRSGHIAPPSDQRLDSAFFVSTPSLPEQARLPEGLGSQASPWLDAYIAFSRKGSPRAYEGFHEACGLWVLSTVAARRVVLYLSKHFFTLLYIALTARTSLFVKSTTAEMAMDTLREAGFDWLLAPDDSTPQRFVYDLSRSVPDNYDEFNADDQARIRKRLALSGQRGWYYDEFGQHLDAMMRPGGYMADFRGLLRRFDDCKPSYETATIGRGHIKVERPYLALLANMTPADIKTLAKRGSALWNDGFWARFAFVAPDREERKRDRFPEGKRIVPTELIDPLQRWHERLGMPDVEIADIQDKEGNPSGRKNVRVSSYEPKSCTLADGVYDAFYRYHDGLLDIVEKSPRADLDGNYARFAEKAMRIAILLASIENHDRIELPHWARGQEIAERWRSNLHALFEKVNEPDESEDEIWEYKLVDVLKRHGKLTAAKASRFIRGLDSTAAKHRLDAMAGSGLVKAAWTDRTCYYELVSQQ